MITPQGPMGRGPYLEGVLKIAPLIAAVLFLVVAAAVVRNFIESPSNPQERSARYDPVDGFGRANARGMAQLIMKKPKPVIDRSTAQDIE
jgi:hypothetical protein